MTRAPNKHVVGRYMLHGEIASGGMATVYFGRLMGEGGFSRVVAVKRLHPQFVRDADFRTMFLDEARVCARVRHPNVVSILDVVGLEGELFLVMEYVQGETLSKLMRASRGSEQALPVEMVASIMSGVLDGLHAAHEACGERGEPLGIVHRDISPQNIIVGIDGVARVVDFGVAKATGRLQTTRDGQLKGKIAYMAPEQLSGHPVDRRTDVYAASVVMWEALAGRRLFDAEQEAIVFGQVLHAPVSPPSHFAPAVGSALDAIILRGLARDPQHRFATALEMAVAIEHTVRLAPPRQVGHHVSQLAQAALQRRTEKFAEIESVPSANIPPPELSVEPKTEVLSQPSSPSLHSLPGVDPRSASHLTNLSMAGQGRPSQLPRSRAGLIAAIAAALLAGALGVAGVLAFSRTESNVVRESEPRAPAATPPSSEPSAAPVASDAPAEPEPTATATAPAPSTPTSHPISKGTTPPAGKPATPKPAAADCNPPYTLDAKGTRIPKLQCL